MNTQRVEAVKISPNLLRQSQADARSIAESLINQPSAYQDDAKIKAIVAETVSGVLNAVNECIGQEDCAALAAAMTERIAFLSDKVFLDVNPIGQVHAEFEAALLDAYKLFRDGKSVHMEIGTFNVWPDERVNAVIAAGGHGDLIRLDMNTSYRPDIAASVTALPFADESIDQINSNSVLEHVAYPHEVIREAFRVLRPGGALVSTVPFHFVEHGCPRDYLRYTGQFFEDVCADAGFERILCDTKSASGAFYTTHQFLKGAIVEGIRPHAKAAQFAHLLSMSLCAAFQALDGAFVGQGTSLYHSTRMMAFKPGDYVTRNDTFDRSKPFVERFSEYLICPATGLPLRRIGEKLEPIDGSRSYDIVDGIANLFVLHGFGSSFNKRASSKKVLADLKG